MHLIFIQIGILVMNLIRKDFIFRNSISNVDIFLV